VGGQSPPSVASASFPDATGRSPDPAPVAGRL